MKVKHKNIASRRTKTQIERAFAELIEERHEIAKITVSELAERAGVTRGTFYAHYDNIYQVAACFREEVMNAFFKGSTELDDKEDVDRFLDKTTDFFKEHEEVYRKLISADRSTQVLGSLNQQSVKRLISALGAEKEPEVRADVEFFVDGTMSLFLKYFREETGMSLDEINLYIKRKFHQMFR